MRTPHIRFLGTPAAASTSVWVNPQSEMLREPNLLIPGRKPVGNVEIDWSNSLTRGLVGYWLLNESGGKIARDLTKHYDGTMSAGMDPSADRIVDSGNRVIDFDGTGDWIDFPTNFTTLVPTYPITIFAYINKTDGIGGYIGIGYDSILTTGVSADIYRGFILTLLDKSGSNYKLEISSGDGSGKGSESRRSISSSNYVVPSGEWVHVCGVMTGATTGALYVNGKSFSFSTSGTGGAVNAAASGGAIGRSRAEGGDSSYYPFGGKISHVGLYNRALSAIEVFNLYRDTYQPLIPS